jgi:hypothetical protein
MTGEACVVVIHRPDASWSTTPVDTIGDRSTAFTSTGAPLPDEAVVDKQMAGR